MKRFMFFVYQALLNNCLEGLCLIIPLSITCWAYSEDDPELLGYRATYPEQMLDIEYLATCPKKCHHGMFFFSDAVASINKVMLKNDQTKFSFTGGFRDICMHLGKHLKHEQTPYGIVGSSLEYYGMNGWQWNADAFIQPDLCWFDLLRTTRYISSLHGMYQQSKELGYHVGAYAETGMGATTVQPIIGIDYKKGSWIYQAVYPVKAGISYIGLPHHIFSVMIRSIYTAIKVEKGFYHHPAGAAYKATGAEVRWDLSPSFTWNFWASIGHTLASSLEVGNKNFHHRKTIGLKGAPYAQVGINLAI